MTIGMIVAIVFGVLFLVVGIGVLIYGFVNDDVGTGVGVFIIGFIISLVLIITPIIYSHTAAGQRAYKDQQSNFNVNQITREVTVYDINTYTETI